MEDKLETRYGGGDLEAGRLQVPRRSPSRASLPQSRDGDRSEQGDDDEDFEWGPAHPCFPHRNPHVPLNSSLDKSTRIIRVRRDWMHVGDLAPTFTNLYPEILDPHISENEFRRVVQHVNAELIAAFNPFSARAWADTVLSVATFWLWEDLGFAGVKARVNKLEEWLREWNATIGRKEGIRIMPLRRTGFLSLDFQIPDPQIGIDTSMLSRSPSTRRSRTQFTETTATTGNPAPYPVNVAPPLPDTPLYLRQGIRA